MGFRGALQRTGVVEIGVSDSAAAHEAVSFVPPADSGLAFVERAPEFSIIRRQGAWRDALLRRMLAVSDVCAGIVAALVFGAGGEWVAGWWFVLLVPVWLVAAKMLSLYDRDQRALRHLTVDELPKIITFALVVAGSLVVPFVVAGRSVDPGADLWAIVAAGATALLLRGLARILWRRATPPERAVVIGTGRVARATKRKLELFPDVHIVFADELPDLTADDLRDPPASLLAANRIVIATRQLDEELIAELVVFCRLRQIKLSVVPPVRGIFGTAVELDHVADLSVLQFNTWDVSRSTMLLKRALDVGVSAALLVLLAPLLVLIAVLIVVDSGRPVLFTQTRVGQHGKPFRMLKFRTMVANAEDLLSGMVPFDSLAEPMFKLDRDPRVTAVGRVLRRTSLDELPQLVNVLAGGMSLVGPRPEQVELVDRYPEQHRVRLWVKPGVTGPMQVYGRGALTFEERLALEREYIENISLGRDLHILALTAASVVHGRGAF